MKIKENPSHQGDAEGSPPAFIGIGGFSLEEVLTLHAHALPRNAQHPPT